MRHLLRGKVGELQKAGTTIVLTTHYMHEAKVLCDRLHELSRQNVHWQFRGDTTGIYPQTRALNELKS